MTSTPDWLYRQSAVIPYVRRNGRFEIALITTRSARHWTIPKGVIERDLTPQDSAAKEALEEAGIVGNVAPEMVAEYEYEKWGGICNVQVYLMEITEVLDSWDEMDLRKRSIVTLSKAVKLIRNEQRPSLEAFRKTFA